MEQLKLQTEITIKKDPQSQLLTPHKQNNFITRQAEEIVKHKQAVKFQISLDNHDNVHENKSEVWQELTKRSDESQFVNWEITTVKSGKFLFNQKQQSKNKRRSLETQRQKEVSHLAQRPAGKKILKINKTEGSHTKEVRKYFGQTLKETLIANKSLKTVFNHFCKQNNLTSIKSTLFDDKIKTMEEMTLNKWMVFCKQFEIYSKLCRIKTHHRQVQQTQVQISLETSQVRELHLVRQAKQVQKRLTNIFKTASNNASKMNFQAFVAAICQIYHQFQSIYSQNQKGIHEFLSEVMYCSQQKSCFKKLSQLKFTFATPKIQYNKVIFPKGESITRLKSISKSKENIQTNIKKQDQFSSKIKVSKHQGKLTLNPILCEAKKVVREPAIYGKSAKCSQKSLTKIKPKDISNPKQKNKQKQLLKYFQSSKDPILESYFMIETGKKVLGQNKKR